MKTVTVSEQDADIRLDRWFKRHYADLTHGELQKMLRDKNIKLNGKKARADLRVAVGDEIAFPDSLSRAETKENEQEVSQKDAEWLQSMVIYKDRDIIAINKPSGLAVQGGGSITRHLDAMLDALSFGMRRPKLVHRLDRNTSGVLLLGRSAQAASWLAEAFRSRDMHKTYLAVVKGRVKGKTGEINAPLRKVWDKKDEKVIVDKKDGLPAVTKYEVLAVSDEASLLKLMPATGRTHQLRVHCQFIGHAILGDDKYGGSKASKLHLHAWEIAIPKGGNEYLRISADLPEYMINTIKSLGFNGEWK